MSRLALIQDIFKKTDFKSYLEIGCFKGKTFFVVDAENKVAVDPGFHYKFYINKVKWAFKKPANLKNQYFKEESDTFFLKRKDVLEKLGTLDVVFVDGLHTYGASLKDVLNSLKYLNNKGIIVMHDCYPPHEAAALPTKFFPTAEEIANVPGWTGDWCGDVWKSIIYLQRAHGDFLDICVIDTETGLGIVKPKSDIKVEELKLDEKLYAEIDKLTYQDLMKDPKTLLNMKDSEYIKTIVEEVVNRAKSN
ncbi:MAG: class I SAM-dependent methyltransferase [Cyclobacteriaceae bacterium]|nr:class I SAM-dependent methyltransferase [Cyclobacteriaceae bacterium]